MTIRLILLTGSLSLFFVCSSTSTVDKPASLQEFKQEEGEAPGKASDDYWAIPEQYKNVPIEQIKSQIEITNYMTTKGAATNAATEAMDGSTMQKASARTFGAGGAAVADETPKNKADREALAQYSNKLISLQGQIDNKNAHPSSALAIEEPEPGKYRIWFCDKTRKPCRYQAYLLYEGP